MAQKPVPKVLPQMVVIINFFNIPTMVIYITHSSDVRGKTLSIHKVFMKHYKNVSHSMVREPVPNILPQTICNKSVVNTPTMARYNTCFL